MLWLTHPQNEEELGPDWTTRMLPQHPCPTATQRAQLCPNSRAEPSSPRVISVFQRLPCISVLIPIITCPVHPHSLPGAGTGLPSCAPPPPPLLPHIPLLSVICQVVRNKVLELEKCSVMSRKGLRLGRWQLRSV